jgi:hypothetical protein
MRDSNVANPAKESAQDEFPHGLLDFLHPANFHIESIWHVRQAVGEWRVFAHSGRPVST